MAGACHGSLTWCGARPSFVGKLKWLTRGVDALSVQLGQQAELSFRRRSRVAILLAITVLALPVRGVPPGCSCAGLVLTASVLVAPRLSS